MAAGVEKRRSSSLQNCKCPFRFLLILTERFTTAVRLKSPQRASAPIELALLDPRGDTALSASGEVSFKTVKGDEVDYLVDWDPVPLRAGGDFQLLIRIAGQPMGTWPLKIVEQNK